MRLLFLPFILIVFSAFSQQFNQVSTLDLRLHECSGLQKVKSNILLALNDGQNPEELFMMDTNGTLLKVIPVIGGINRDWEALSVNDKGELLIADIGNNNNDRHDLTIYKTEPFQDYLDTIAILDSIRFTYSDQMSFPPTPARLHHDAEALIATGDSIYIFTKNRSVPYNGMCYLYGLSNQPNIQVAALLDSFYIGGLLWQLDAITDASINQEHNQIALLNSSKVYTLSNFQGSHFFKGDIKVINLNHTSQKEGITYSTSSKILIADESETEPTLYKLLFPDQLNVEDVFPEIKLVYHSNEILIMGAYKLVYNYELTSIDGKQISKGQITESQTISTSTLRSGMYLFSLHSGGQTYLMKFSK